MRRSVAVIGSGEEDPRLAALAERVGVRLAEAGCRVVTGGLGGVMAAASRGAKSAGGLTVGILPGTDAREANEWVDVPVVTGQGEGRNLLVVRNAGAVVAVGGGYGTLSEIAFALKLGTPVIGLDTWDLPANDLVLPHSKLLVATDPDGAVAMAVHALSDGWPS